MSEVSQTPSWIDRLTAWIDDLPFPVWVFYLLVYLGAALAYHAAMWIDRVVPVGEVSSFGLMGAVWSCLPLGVIHWASRAGAAALDRFAPVITDRSEALAEVRERMSTLPRRSAFWLHLGVGVVIAGAELAEPDFVYEGLAHPVSIALALALVFTSYAFAGPGFLLSFRALAAISDAYALPSEVDPFRQRVLYAPAGVAMRIGVGLLVIANFSAISTFGTNPTTSEGVLITALLALNVPLALAALLVPVRGIHRRLVDAKHQLLEENAAEIAAVRLKLYAALRRDAHADVDSFDRGLSSLFRLRDELGGISTWPWSRGAASGYITAVVLPLVVWGVQQVITEAL